MVKILFQKEIHAIEIDDGTADVQRVHPQNPTDSGGPVSKRAFFHRESRAAGAIKKENHGLDGCSNNDKIRMTKESANVG